MPGFESQALLLIQLSADVQPRRQQVKAQVLVSLSLTWKVQSEFLAPDLDLAQAWLLWVFRGSEPISLPFKQNKASQ